MFCRYQLDHYSSSAMSIEILKHLAWRIHMKIRSVLKSANLRTLKNGNFFFLSNRYKFCFYYCTRLEIFLAERVYKVKETGEDIIHRK